MLKRFAALVTILGILSGTFLLVKFYQISPIGPCYAEWKQIQIVLDHFWNIAMASAAFFMLTALIPAMHTLFPPPPPPDPQLIATIENNRQTIKELQAKIEESEARQHTLQSEAARAQARVTELETKLAHVTNELNSYIEKDNTLANDYQRALERCNQLNQELIEASDKRRLLQAERDQAQREAAQLAQELAETRQQLAQARAAADATIAEAQSIAAKLKTEAKAEIKAENESKDKDTTKGNSTSQPQALEKTQEATTDVEQITPLADLTASKKSATGAIGETKSTKVAPDAAFQILYLLQKEGRLLDFLSEDLSGVDDEQLGGAVRPIHEGLRRILSDRLVIAPVLDLPEGEFVDLGENVDPEKIKLIGNVQPKGPYRGILVHRGWRLKECKLPSLVSGWAGDVIVPAEVEIS